MTTRSPRLPLYLAIGLAAGGVALHAASEPLGQHPAVIVHARPATIDPNAFIVAPPATTSWTRGHSNGEHPAVQAARRASQAGIDGNTFTVQPPASVSWTLGPGDEAAPPNVERTALLR